MSLFVGRDREVATLRALLGSTSARRPAAAFVFGDPGAGKTRLLHEAIDDASRRRVLSVVGYEPEGGVPLAAARSLLRDASTASRHGQRLAHVLAGHEGAPGGLEAVRVFEAVHHCLAELAPLVIVADDLQWADEVSLALCHFVIRAARSDGYGVALLAASREAPQVRRLAASLADALGGPERAAIVELGPLGPEAGVALARQSSPRLSDEEAMLLYRRAGGSPFWLNTLAASEHPAAEITSLVSTRMRGATPDGGWLLALLAIRRRPMPVAQLEEILEWPAERVERAVRALANVGLVIVDGPRLRLAHDLIGDAASALLPAMDSAHLRRRLADVIEEQAGQDVQALAEAADFRLAAGLPALDLVLRICRSPGRRLLGRDGVARLARLLDEFEARSPGRRTRRSPKDVEPAELTGELAALAREVGHPELALELWRRAAGLARSPRDRARTALEAARIAFLLLGRYELGEELLAQSRAALADGEIRVEQEVLDGLIARHVRKDRAAASRIAARSLASARRAVADCRTAGREIPPNLRSAWLEALRGAYDEARLTLDDPAAMLALAREMEDAAGDSADARLSAEFHVAMALRGQCRWSESERAFQQAWRSAHDWILPLVAAETGYWLGDVLRTLGRLDESRRVAAETVRVGQRVGDRRASWDARWLLRVLDLSTGDWRRAVEGLVADLEEEPDAHARIETHTTIAEWLARFAESDERSRVIASLEQGDRDSVAAACRRCRREFLVRAAETRARLGLVDEAGAALAEWDREQRTISPLSALWRLRAGGVLALARGDDGAAVVALESLVATADGYEMRLEACRARLDLAAVLLAVDRERAIAVLREAAGTARAIGAQSEARAAQRVLRRAGIRLSSRVIERATAIGGPALGALTPSELAVARLAASGASNSEIGAALFITRKTVERHMSRALAKLGARNRTELATRIRSEIA